MERARGEPFAGAVSATTSTAFDWTSPSATSKRAGRPFRNFFMMPSRSIPMIPACGPVMPTSLMNAVPRKDLLVGGGDVRVRPNHRGDAPIQVPAHGHFFAGGFRVDIHDDNADAGRDARQLAVEIGRASCRERV